MKLHYRFPPLISAAPPSSQYAIVRWLAKYGCAVLVSCLGIRTASAATVAFDQAQDATYAAETGGAWIGLNPTSGENPVNPPAPDNGGTGFDTWNFAGGYQQPTFSPYGDLNHFIDGVDFPASSYNQLGSPAFGLTNANVAFGGDTSRATRGFVSPLGVGDTLSINFDNPLLAPLDPFAPPGFLFRLNNGRAPVIDNDPTSTAKERFGIFTTSNFNSGRWYITDLSAGFTDTGLAPAATASGTQFSFTLTSAETYSVKFVELGNGTTLYAHSGSLANTGAGAIDCLEITLFSNGSGDGSKAGGSPTGEREFFFNNLQISHPLIGDYNHNGVVDAADYTLWRNTLGSTADLGADGNGNGVIDTGDYDVWKAHYGEIAGGGASAVKDSAVPEPATLWILLIGVLAMWSRRRPKVS